MFLVMYCAPRNITLLAGCPSHSVTRNELQRRKHERFFFIQRFGPPRSSSPPSSDPSPSSLLYTTASSVPACAPNTRTRTFAVHCNARANRNSKTPVEHRTRFFFLQFLLFLNFITCYFHMLFPSRHCIHILPAKHPLTPLHMLGFGTAVRSNVRKVALALRTTRPPMLRPTATMLLLRHSLQA